MADDSPYDISGPAPEVHEAASLLRAASNPIRLQILIALAQAGEPDAGRLSKSLGGLEPSLVYRNLGELYSRSLVSRRSLDGQYVFAIAQEGRAIVDAFEAICKRLSKLPTASPAVGMRDEPPHVAASTDGLGVLCTNLSEAVNLLKYAANPVRLGLMLLLAESEMDAGQLCEAMGSVSRHQVNKHLEILAQGGFLSTGRQGSHHGRRLTRSGLDLVEFVRSISSLASSDFNDEARPPGTLRPDPGVVINPASPEEVASLFGTFADPVRLRILNLLVGSAEVCLCHLQGALGVSRSTLRLALKSIEGAGLIRERFDGVWTYYGPTPPMDLLHRALNDKLGSQFSNLEFFENDRHRLRGLAACPTRKRGPLKRRISQGESDGSGMPTA